MVMNRSLEGAARPKCFAREAAYAGWRKEMSTFPNPTMLAKTTGPERFRPRFARSETEQLKADAEHRVPALPLARYPLGYSEFVGLCSACPSLAPVTSPSERASASSTGSSNSGLSFFGEFSFGDTGHIVIRSAG
jgi:hypothetical protein